MAPDEDDNGSADEGIDTDSAEMVSIRNGAPEPDVQFRSGEPDADKR